MTKSSDDPIDIAAAHLARVDSGNVTRKERDEFQSWCDSAPENLSAWERVNAAWDQVPSADEQHIQQMIGSAMMRNPVIVAPSAAPRRWAPAAIAASLLIAFAPPTAWFFYKSNGFHAETSGPFETVSKESLRMASTPGNRRHVRLSDGSRVTLDARSAIRVAFAEGQRHIWLEEGRAHFAVHKDKSRPFIVDAGRLRAIAVGTAFDVSRSDMGENVVTSEGLVRVLTEVPDKNGARVMLVPAGMKLHQDAKGVQLANADVLSESAWQSGKIIFSAECLAHVASRINRYSKQQLIVEEDAARIVISGVFDLDNAHALAQSLKDQGIVAIASASDAVTLTRGLNGRAGRCKS